ncbi:hypothetical protein [Mesorhizobium comanense]|uniref:hypothetical protein n=1 Tax=Mesorhizobium comanense TaxID=2502215 RepID=UPI0010F8558C|nr:hypothetical protein [Mesorhizobium comanense]
MVHVIPLSVGQRRRDAGNPVPGPDSPPPGEAVQPLDDEWQALAGHYELRQAQQQAFDTEIAARRLNGQLAQAEADAVANAAADGAGLHDAMYGQVDPRTGQVVKTGLFDTLFDDFVKQAPAELRPGLASRKPALREAGSIRMAQQQNQRRRDYEQVEVGKVLKTGAIAIGDADPHDHVTFEAARQEGLDLIDRMGVDPGIRQQMAKEWFGTAAKARFEALIARDPQRALDMLGAGPAVGDPGTEPLADLLPDDVRRLLGQARAAAAARLIEARVNIDLADQNAPDAVADAGNYSGTMPSPADFTAVYGAEEGGKRYQEFSRKIDVGRQAFAMRTMPNQAIHASLRDAEPGPGSSDEDLARYQLVAVAALRALSLRRADPGGYVRAVFPEIDVAWSEVDKLGVNDREAYSRAIALSVAAQRQLGIQNPQPLPKAVVRSIAERFGEKNIPRADRNTVPVDLSAGPTSSDRGEDDLYPQPSQAEPYRPVEIDPITTAATGDRSPASTAPAEPKSAFRQTAEDFGDYLSEGFEALGRAPHDIGLALRELRDSPGYFLEQLPVTPGSRAIGGGADQLRWLGAAFFKGGRIADELIEPTLKAFSRNYKKTFFDNYPELVGLVFIHHRIEQQVLRKYIGVISEEMMHSLENLRGIPRELNSVLHLSTIRREWNAFYRQNPTATLQKLLEKAEEIDRKYGHLFNPPIGKK